MDIEIGRVGATRIIMEANVVGQRSESGIDGRVTVPLYDVTAFRAVSAKRKPILSSRDRAVLGAIGPSETAGLIQVELYFENGQRAVLVFDESLQTNGRNQFALKIANVPAPGLNLGWRQKFPGRVNI